MSQNENNPDSQEGPKRQDAFPEDLVIWVEGEEDTTVSPSPIPIRLPVPKEELYKYPPDQLDEVICADGPEDTTIRPRDPRIPIFWPKDIPLPKPPPKGSPQSPSENA